MSNSSKHWLPAAPGLTLGQRWALAVPERTSGPMTQQQYLLRLEDKLQQLARPLTPSELRAALELSQEQLPEIYSLAQEGLTADELGTVLLQSDSLQLLLNRIDWTSPGETRPSREQSLDEILEQLMP